MAMPTYSEEYEELMKQMLVKEKPAQDVVNKHHGTNPVASFAMRKKQALTAARELGYDEDIKDRIRDAANELQIDRALSEGRHRKFDRNPRDTTHSPTGRKKRKDYNR